MSRIDRVEIHAFRFQVQDIGLGAHSAAGVGNVIYKKGATFSAERFAVRILCDDGASGEYVTHWVGTPSSLGQCTMLAPNLLGRDPEQRAIIYDDLKREIRAYDSLGRLTGVNQSSGGSWSRSLGYDTLGRPGSETVTIDGVARTTTTYYDAWQRPYASQYPGTDNEVVKVNYNSMGLPKLMCKSYLHSSGSYWCTGDPWYVSDATYDVAGRLTKMKYPAGGSLWRTQSYHTWTTVKNGGLLNEIKVGTDWTHPDNSKNRFYRAYTYNSFGDVATLKEGSTTYSFGYDNLGRLLNGYGKSYTYWATNRINSFEGKSFGYTDSRPYHGIKSDNSGYSYVYDANGNLTAVEVPGITVLASYGWNAENRLQSAVKNGVSESYAYDADGKRIKKVSGGVTSRTFFPGLYEEEVSGSTTTAVKHYSFNGQIIAVRRGSVLRYTHTDHLGSSSGQTDANGAAIVDSYLRYYAYGGLRSGNPVASTTDRTFTGQKSDGTGLMFYEARYYDPALGTFLSPDTIVPDAGVVIDYNRFLYVRANPLSLNDPTGHCAQTIGDEDFECFYWAQKIDQEFGWPRVELEQWSTENLTELYNSLSTPTGEKLPEPALKRGTLTIGVGGAIFALVGARGAASLSFDRSGNAALHVTAGGGGYTAIGTNSIGPAITVTNAPNVALLKGPAVQFGGQVGEIASIGAEGVFFSDAERNQYFGLTVSGGAALQGPFPGELHATVERDIFFVTFSLPSILDQFGRRR